MALHFYLMTADYAYQLLQWRYEEPFAIYNMGGEESAEFLDQRSPYYAVCNDHGEMVGFFAFGTSAQPWNSPLPSLYVEDRVILIGLGMKPELTGKGQGLAFVQAGLEFAHIHFRPRLFRLYVLSFNTRAIRVYERAGFTFQCVKTIKNKHGELEFYQMECKV